MNAQRWLGIALLWAGFLTGALVTVLQPERDAAASGATGGVWWTIDWRIYAVAIAAGAVGVALIRRAGKPTPRQAANFQGQIERMQRAVEAVAAAVGGIRGQTARLAPSAIRELIDERCSGPLVDFAECRNAVVHRHGLQTYADVMTDFALAERYINRAWCAAADGYLDEVDRCLEIASGRLSDLKGRLAVC